MLQLGQEDSLGFGFAFSIVLELDREKESLLQSFDGFGFLAELTLGFTKVKEISSRKTSLKIKMNNFVKLTQRFLRTLKLRLKTIDYTTHNFLSNRF